MINFCANFKINNNVYNNLQSKDSREVIENVIEKYKKFIEHPKIEALTKEDTIEFKRAKHITGCGFELEITSPHLKEPYITGIYTNKKNPNINPNEFIHQTLLYICFKFGQKPRPYENSFKFIKRVLFNETKNNG